MLLQPEQVIVSEDMVILGTQHGELRFGTDELELRKQMKLLQNCTVPTNKQKKNPSIDLQPSPNN